MPPTEETLTPEEELSTIVGDEEGEGKPKPPEPTVVEKMREPTEDELRGAASRFIQENPEQFRAYIPEREEPEEPSYDPTAIHERAVQEAEQRMLVRQRLVDHAFEDAQRAFAGKGVPDHVFSKVRSTLNDPKLSLEQLAEHIKQGGHKGIVTHALGEAVLAGDWSPQTTNSGGEPVGGGGSGLNQSQREELGKAEALLGRKLTPQEQREWVVSN